VGTWIGLTLTFRWQDHRPVLPPAQDRKLLPRWPLHSFGRPQNTDPPQSPSRSSRPQSGQSMRSDEWGPRKAWWTTRRHSQGGTGREGVSFYPGIASNPTGSPLSRDPYREVQCLPPPLRRMLFARERAKIGNRGTAKARDDLNVSRLFLARGDEQSRNPPGLPYRCDRVDG
jgi:hypothetical protein